MARLQQGVNDLKTWCVQNGKYGQRILNEWVGIYEDNSPIDINNISFGSNKKVQWKCKDNHIWMDTIVHRTSNKRGCPYCAGKRVSDKNSLLDWCQENSEFGQQLLQEWTGLDENNNPININEVARASKKKIQWKCKEGHTWLAVVGDRTLKKTRCPYCFGNNIVREDNRLDIWCQENGEFGQQLIQEWVGLDENENPIEIDEVARASNKKVQWKCKEGHTWLATIANRINSKYGCPYCAGKKVSDKNSLRTWCQTNGELGEQLLQEWTGLYENNDKVETTDISYASNKKVQWKCAEEHVWTATILNRTFSKSSCPYCAGKKVSDKNSLRTWCQDNGEFGQQLLSEWVGLDENNNQIEIDEVSYASNKKVQWKCRRGHTWITAIYSRTSQKAGCTHCNSYGTSFPEQFIYHSLKQIYPNIITRGKYQGYEYDITIPELRLCIEYSGIKWHADKLARDKEKKQLCKKHRVNFLQIYAHRGEIKDRQGNVVNDSYTKEQIIYRINNNKDLHKIQLILLIEFILKQYAPEHTIAEINFAQAESDSYATIQGNA